MPESGDPDWDAVAKGIEVDPAWLEMPEDPELEAEMDSVLNRRGC